MSLVSGRSPSSLLGDGPDTFSIADLEVLAQYKAMRDARCPGCGRPLSQHLYNAQLGREETAEDYKAWSVDCPAMEALADGQQLWKTAHKQELKAHYKGDSPDPSMGTYWLAQGPGEALPQGQE